MIKIIDGDLLNARTDIIAHQVNCRGAFNSGVAKAIRIHDFQVFRDYKTFCGMYTPEQLLGTVRYFESGVDGKIYASLFAQDAYGYGQQYTNIAALRKCFRDLQRFVDMHRGMSIAMPYKIGCVRGGANWEEVFTIIKEELGNCNVELWRLNAG